MEAHIYDIASNAGRVLLNPFLLTVPALGALVLVTGFAGRVAMSIEDLHSRHTHLVHVDRQLINASGFSAVPSEVEELPNRHARFATTAAIGVPDAWTK